MAERDDQSLMKTLIARLLGTAPDPKESLRPLWHRIVELAREPDYYARLGVEDSVSGRFDMITAVMAMVLIRMEKEEPLVTPSVYLTELFVDDMAGQVRQIGVGDLVVGKQMGKLVSTMGGRLGAYRTGLAAGHKALSDAVARNVSLRDGYDADGIATALENLSARLDQTEGSALLRGEIVL
ncbi:MAG: ubiquinol-cytochrome C chaperone family protein [Sphingomonadaceae bacterium]